MGTGPSLNAIAPAQSVLKDKNCNVAWAPIQNNDVNNYLSPEETKEADERTLQIVEHPVFVEKLTEVLCRGSKNDISSVRSIYTWICNNIRYDTTSCCVDVTNILNTRRCSSGGFVCLFEEMCRFRNIPVVRLTSYVKNLSFELSLDNVEDKNNLHVWNAVFLNQKHYFIDCTWGAATIAGNRDNRSIESTENIEHFFFTPTTSVGTYC